MVIERPYERMIIRGLVRFPEIKRTRQNILFQQSSLNGGAIKQTGQAAIQKMVFLNPKEDGKDLKIDRYDDLAGILIVCGEQRYARNECLGTAPVTASK